MCVLFGQAPTSQPIKTKKKASPSTWTRTVYPRLVWKTSFAWLILQTDVRISGWFLHSQRATHSSDTSGWQKLKQRTPHVSCNDRSGVKWEHLLIIHKKTYDQGKTLLRRFKIFLWMFLRAALFLIWCCILDTLSLFYELSLDFCNRYFLHTMNLKRYQIMEISLLAVCYRLLEG